MRAIDTFFAGLLLIAIVAVVIAKNSATTNTITSLAGVIQTLITQITGPLNVAKSTSGIQAKPPVSPVSPAAPAGS